MTTPASSQGPSHDVAGLLRKRKQLSSCDSCRARRIRCVRDNNAEVCVPCKDKNVKCTSNYIQSAPKLNSTSKRVATSHLNHGSPGAGPLPVRNHHERPDAPALDSSVSWSNRSFTPTFSKYGNFDEVMASAEVSGAFGKHLVDSYYECLHFACPAVRWDLFYQEALVAGFNASQMGSPEGEVLCLVIQAFGARVSDHPFILGRDAPNRESLQRGNDLSDWGRKRKPFCMALFHRANKAFYSHGIGHRVSVRSISIMMILFWLWENTHPENLNEPRLLTSNAIEQMRIIIEREEDYSPEDISDIRGGRLFWTIFCGESACSAYTNRQLQMSIQDIQNFSPAVLQEHQEQVDIPPTIDSDTFLSNVAVRLLGDMAMIGRTVSAYLTSPTIKNEDVNVIVYTNIWGGIDAHARLSEWVQRKMEELYDRIPFASEIWLKTNVCARVGYCEVIDKSIKEKLARARKANDLDAVYLLEQMAHESDGRVFRAQVELSEALASHSHSKIIAFGGTLLMSLPACIDKLLSVPAFEEGGNIDYPLSKKVSCCEVILDNIKFTGFSWDVHTWVTDTEKRLSTLRNLAGIATPHPPPISMYNIGLPDPNFDFFDPYITHPLFPSHYTNQAFLEEPMHGLDQPFIIG